MSCSCDNSLQELKIVFAPQYVNINYPATCSSFEFELIDIKRRVISEKAFLKMVAYEIERLERDNQNKPSSRSVDVRIRCLMNYGNKVDTLCLGEYTGILLNGELMNDSQTLLDLLKSEIYNN
jgi:hypothetical protein